jgi:glycosyltransferase involved in cell wall biosynthesis
MAHIVIDARLISASTGHYSEHLLNQLQTIDTTNHYTVVVLEKEKDHWKPTAKNFTVTTAPYKNYTFGEQLGFALFLYRLKPDLVHFTMPQQPLLWLGRRVTTVHDLTLVRFENIDQNVVVYKIRKFLFAALLRNVMWRSKVNLVPTEYVRQDILSWTKGTRVAPIVVTHEAGDPLHDKPTPVQKLKEVPYLFFVGNAFPYKNLWRTVDAYRELKKRHPTLQLAFAGKKDYFYEELEARIQSENIKDVHILGYVSDGEKRWLFANAVAYVTSSYSEGFHIPMLEAMYERCPVVSSNATCLPEVGGDAARYFDPASTKQAVAAIEPLMTDQALRSDMIARGTTQVKQFSWRRMAEQIHEQYVSALK